MSFDIVSKRNILLYALTPLIILALTLSVDAQLSVSDHEGDESPHIGTIKTLEYFEKHLTEHIQLDNDSRNNLEDKIDMLIMVVCSNPNNKCPT